MSINYMFCNTSWSPIAASGPQSTLSGVLAGFVFAGIVVVLSTTPARDESESAQRPAAGLRGSVAAVSAQVACAQKSSQSEAGDSQAPVAGSPRSYALQLLTAAFIIFALDSYFTSITAGEQACNRAYAESILSAGVLGTGAVMLVAALSWLLITYFDKSDGVRLVLKIVVISMWGIVIAMLALSGMTEGQAILPKRQWLFVDIAPYVVAMIFLALILRAAMRMSNFSQNDLPNRILGAAVTAIVSALASGILVAVASSFSAHWWYRPASIAVYACVVISLIVPLTALLASVTAALMPVRSESAGTRPERRRALSQILQLMAVSIRAPTAKSDSQGAALPGGEGSATGSLTD